MRLYLGQYLVLFRVIVFLGSRPRPISVHILTPQFPIGEITIATSSSIDARPNEQKLRPLKFTIYHIIYYPHWDFLKKELSLYLFGLLIHSFGSLCLWARLSCIVKRFCYGPVCLRSKAVPIKPLTKGVCHPYIIK